MCYVVSVLNFNLIKILLDTVSKYLYSECILPIFFIYVKNEK